MLRSISVMAGPSPSRVTGVASSSGGRGRSSQMVPSSAKRRVWIDPVRRNPRAAQSNLLLHGEHAVEVHRVAPAFEQRHERGAAGAVVKTFPADGGPRRVLAQRRV